LAQCVVNRILNRIQKTFGKLCFKADTEGLKQFVKPKRFEKSDKMKETKFNKEQR
jgi:hypothetical protein